MLHNIYHGRLAGCTGVLLRSRDLAHLDTGSGTQLGKEDKEKYDKQHTEYLLLGLHL